MDDRERWDTKYGGALGRERFVPEPLVERALDALGDGGGRRALDVACGLGRHLFALAERGWEATGWDVSGVGLDLLARRADERGQRFATRRLDALDAGARAAALAADGPFDLVTVVHFLDRDLLRDAATLVRAGGHVIVCTFTSDYPGDRPPPRFRLEPGELRAGLAGATSVLCAEEGGQALLLARSESQPGRP